MILQTIKALAQIGQRPTDASAYYSPTITVSDETRGRATSYDPKAARDIASCVSIVAVCSTRIASMCAATPLRLYAPAKSKGNVSRSRKSYLRDTINGPGRKAALAAQRADEIEEITDHPVLDLLADPSDFEIGLSSAELRFTNRMLSGNSYTLVVSDGKGVPTELFDLCPAWVQVQPSKANFIEGYRYGRDTSEQRIFSPADVIHGRERTDPQTPYMGRGVVSDIWGEHQLYMAISQKQLVMMDNLGRPDFVVSLDAASLTEQTVAQLRQQIESMLRGVNKTGRFLIFPKSTSVTPLQFAPKDMGEIDTQKYLASVIAGAFGIAESDIFLNDANLASAQSGRVQTARNAVLPRLQKDAQILTERLLNRYPDLLRRGAWLAYDNPVPEDETATQARLVAMVGSGILTPDEARGEIGYEPLPDGMGEKPRGYVDPTLGLGANREPSPPGETPPADETPPPEKRAPDKCCAHTKRTTLSKMHADADRVFAKSVASILDNPAQQNEPVDIRMYRGIRRGFREQMKGILERMDANPFGLDAKSINAKAYDDPALRAILQAWGISTPRTWDQLFMGIGPLVQEAVGASVLSELAALKEQGWEAPQPDEFYVSSGPVVQALQARAAGFAESIVGVNNTTAERLGNAIAESLAAGEGLATMKQRVRAAFEAETDGGIPIADYRAASIARTETTRAQDAGKIAAWKSSDAVKGKVWLQAPLCCEFCAALAAKTAGKPIGVDEPFLRLGETLTGTDGGVYVNDYGDVQGAPLHPNDRCTTRAVLFSEG